ncbi:hypothetical protein [Bradyrhizobium yuanmingense]|uniref:Uncharacterized protein n=1 Tax=Bradyrhizobium yuanmingense TaxID=108015 RepID=A0ABV4G7F1_9BRAD|nr:hypothetical protein [Bradyrhizobium yuanmingense]
MSANAASVTIRGKIDGHNLLPKLVLGVTLTAGSKIACWSPKACGGKRYTGDAI